MELKGPLATPLSNAGQIELIEFLSCRMKGWLKYIPMCLCLTMLYLYCVEVGPRGADYKG
jgi:hypothetical protein